MDIKVENADPNSSHPLVIDVWGYEGAAEPLETHVLKFGEFVIVTSLYNLEVVSFEDWTKRQVEAEAKAATEAARTEGYTVPEEEPKEAVVEPPKDEAVEPARWDYKPRDKATADPGKVKLGEGAPVFGR